MVLAADYPFMDVLWTMIIFFAWVVWIWMVVLILIDVFRRRDIGGWAKAGWTVFIIVIPFIAALIYLIAEHDGMADRAADRMRGQQAQFDSYVRTVADSGGAASEIDRAKKLLDDGAITQSEFEALKAKALAAA
jgi:Short C-terminal domain